MFSHARLPVLRHRDRRRRPARLLAVGAALCAAAVLSSCTSTPAPHHGGAGDRATAKGTNAARPAPSASTFHQGRQSIPAADVSIAHRTASGGHSVALTFDDGPGPLTGQVLDLLARYHVKATFCLIGPQAAAYPDMVRRMRAEGHRLCDHTVHHNERMHALPESGQRYEIDGARKMIEQAGGPGTQVSYFRAPGGDFTPAIRRMSAGMGLRPLGWTVDTLDWERPGVAAILAHIRHQLHPGGIVLMHDAGGDRSQTVEALRELLPELRREGWTFDFPALRGGT